MKDNDKIAILAEKAYQLGFQYEKEFMGCGQSMVAAVLDTLDVESDKVFKAATGFAGGIGVLGDGSCGAYIGGVMLIGLHLGREINNFKDPKKIRWKTYELVKQFHDKFIEHYGNVTCREIQCKIFGRSFYGWDEEAMKKFEKAGGHEDKCTNVVGLASRWVIAILGKEDLIGRKL